MDVVEVNLLYQMLDIILKSQVMKMFRLECSIYTGKNSQYIICRKKFKWKNLQKKKTFKTYIIKQYNRFFMSILSITKKLDNQSKLHLATAPCASV